MAMQFKKAERKKVYAKILMAGASGSGKSFSALRMAKGLAKKCDSRIAYIGTEGSRDEYYCTVNEGEDGLFDYDLISLDSPFSIEKYIEAIDAAIDAGYQVLIIDSLTPEWKYLNEIHDAMPGNSFQNWGKLKSKHRSFMDKILLSPIHIIATARSKTDWVLEDKNGKQVPKKVGLAAMQDSEISYEYTVSFVIDQDSHVAVADKDNTRLFNGRYEMITEKNGEALYDWCNTGKIAVKPKELPKYETPMPEDILKSLKKDIITVATEKGRTDGVMDIIKKYVPNGNPNGFKEVEDAKKCLEELKNYTEE